MIFHKILRLLFDLVLLCTICKIETQKIVNLSDDTDNKSSKFATRKWYVINYQNNTKYGEINENDFVEKKLLNQVFVVIQIHIFL